MKTVVLPYKVGSRSARIIAEALGVKRLKLQGSRFNKDWAVINWGSSAEHERAQAYINHPSSVAIAACKLKSLQALSEDGVRVPPFTTDPNVACDWVNAGHTVVARTMLRANSGRGIVIVEEPKDFVVAPLYTKYVKKVDEYRIHIFDGKIIDCQRKMRDTDVPDEQVNWQIRNHGNGFVFGRGGVNPPDDVLYQALRAVNAVGLDFGAVDVGFNAARSEATVYEINTAPALEGTTLEKYTEAFQEYFKE